MLRFLFLLHCLLIPSLVLGQTILLTGKNWSYKKVAIISQQDTLLMFHADSSNNIWYLGKVSLQFKVDGSFEGKDTDGLSRGGVWGLLGTKTIYVDRDTNQITSLTNNQLLLSGQIVYRDSIDSISGTLITELYPTPSIVSSCESLRSGDWSSPTSWSCGREPTGIDVVLINPQHTITVTVSLAQAQRIIYNGGSIKYLPGVKKVFIKGGD